MKRWFFLVMFVALPLGLAVQGCGNGSSSSNLDDAVELQDEESLDAVVDSADVDKDQQDQDSADETIEPVPDPTRWAFERDHVLEIEIRLPDESWDFLRLQGRSLFDIFGPECMEEPFESPFTWMRGDVVIDGELVEDVAIRKKGFLGSLSTSKPSLKLKFDEYIEDREYRGFERMTFNNARQDPSYLNQCLTYDLFAEAGLPAPRFNFAQISRDGEPLGLYVHVDSIKKAFLRRHFEDDEGKLYEGTLSDFRDGWTYTFAKKTDKDETDDRSELSTAVAALDAPDQELEAALQGSFDLEQFYRFWAAEVLVAHWDGYSGNTNNFYIYADPTDDNRFTFIPWGADATFQDTSSRFEEPRLESVMATGRLARRIYLHPALRDHYVKALRDLLDTVWDEDALLASVDMMQNLIEPHLLDEEKPAVLEAIDVKRQFIRARRDTLLNELEPAPPAWDIPLRDRVCAHVVGDISGTFSTTWGTGQVDDLFTTGTGTMAATIDGNMAPLTTVGAKAGTVLDGADRGRAAITVAGIIQDGPVVVLIFVTDMGNLQPGAMALDWTETDGSVYLFLPDEQRVVPFGFIFSGTLELTEASDVDGAPLSGSFTGEIFQL